MTTRIEPPITQDKLFVWVMHRFAEVFEAHAVLKGGMVLRLLDSPRHTNDVDYVFVPYTSKKGIRDQVVGALADLEGATTEVTMHSQMIRVELSLDRESILVKVTVAANCASTPMTTGGFARAAGQPPRVIRVMHLDTALANKIAAWNERRLLRDLYDIYFLAARAQAKIEMDVLDARLAAVQSRLPKMRKVSEMSREALAAELLDAVTTLEEASVNQQLRGLIPADELAGLVPRLAAAISRLARQLTTAQPGPVLSIK
jgi:predicted nucleotidyltransferase component of viral defense system